MRNWGLNLVFDRLEDRAIAAETLAAVLDDLGSLGWQEKALGPKEEPPLCVFFPAAVLPDDAMKRVRQAAKSLQAAGVLRSLPRLSAVAVEERDWVAEFRRGFRGVRVARGLCVVPPWRPTERAKALRPGEVEIIIEPGMAFRTGLHETTRLCLRLLQREIRGGERVADVGAGSGILSIAAVKLGARSALAIEVDPEAHDNLHENLRLNHVARQVKMFKGDAAAYASRHRRGAGFDLIVCNILFEKMRPLLSHFNQLAPRNAAATVIVSGFLWAERHEAAAALAAAGIEITCARRMKD
jgi:ribosomal protein L11 methyltransferase